MSEAVERIKAHSDKQAKAFFSDSKITACITGIQWGKTTAGAIWMRNRLFEHGEKDSNFIITAPTYKILEQSTLPAFNRELSGFGTYYRQRAMFEYDIGLEDANPKVYFRTATEPDSVVGVTNVQGIWCDEAGKYPLYFWENIQGRAAFKNCPIMITTSPYSMNWIYKDILKPVREGKRNDILLIQAASNENPHFPQDVYEHNRLHMDPRRFNLMFNGNFERLQGLVYSCFDEKENQCQAFKLPEATRYYGGIDWGFTEPFVFKVRAITPDGNHYGVSEYYKSGLTINDMIAVVKAKCQVFNIKQIYCGPDQPGHILEMQRNKIPAIAADNDLMRGIGLHYELLSTRRLKYFTSLNPYTLDEIETYHYAEPKDLKPDDDAKESKPVGQNDHSLDADRYITISTYHSFRSLTPKAPEEVKDKTQETNQARINRLMKKRSNIHTENWE